MPRECDPNKCRGCKSYVAQAAAQEEVQVNLMQQLTGAPDKRGLFCKNVQLTQSIGLKKVFTARSVLCHQIVGLYAGEKIRKDKLIMEYTG